jgi:hypothetical protein
MQKMRIRMQHGNKLMLARPSSGSVGLSSGRALGIDRLCTLMLLVLATTASWAQVVSPNLGSVSSGPATSEVLRLTLSEAISRAMRYNLGVIESDENTRSARGQRLIALSNLLPQVSAGINENVDQINFTALGLGSVKIPGIPRLPVHSVTVRRVQALARRFSATNRFSASVLRAPPNRPPSSVTKTRWM